jgi:asparagine synthase (glutamine-hydrolysing)
MCGIIGIANLSGRGAPLARESLAPALDCLAHRGPDDQGFFLGPGVALGFRRLSIWARIFDCRL